jgi:hypothetical protein
MMDYSTLSPTVLTVQPSPAQFGCVPGTSSAAISPFEVDIVKVNPLNYWFSNGPANLRWFLGVQPANGIGGYPGSLLSFGWLAQDYSSGLPGPTLLGNSADALTLSVNPVYNLLLAGGALGTWSSLGAYPAPTSTDTETNCLAGGGVTRQWNVTWTPASPFSTPGYPYDPSQQVVEAQYWETGGTYQGPDNIENWYFAPGIGPVKVEVLDRNFNIIRSMGLVGYTAGNGSSVSPYVTLRDLLLAQAGAYNSTLNSIGFSQWSTYFSQATNLQAPTSAQACLNGDPNTPISVDAYLLLLENVGQAPPYCSTLLYPATPNGATANDTLTQMISLMGSSSGFGYDQWNWAFGQVENKVVPYPPPPAPEANCMVSQTTVDPPSGNPIVIVPGRFVLLTAREWLLFWGHQGGNPATQVFACAN